MWAEHSRDIAVEGMACNDERTLPGPMVQEVFDMVMPADPNSFTLAELQACSFSEHVCGMLIDGQCLYDYDQREAYAQQQAAQMEDLPDFA